MTKISFICTVLNEKEGIRILLESLNLQTRQADEIVIVDAGSTDGTIKAIAEFQPQLPIKIITEQSTRGRGRNLAIQEARGEVIAVSDAGCIAHPDWLEKITKPIITKKAHVVAGFYNMRQDIGISYFTGPYLGTMSYNINTQTFLPSSRSLAFTKKAWKKVQGYPEQYQYAAEDLVF